MSFLREIAAELFNPHRKQKTIPPLDGGWTSNDQLENSKKLPYDFDNASDMCSDDSGNLYVANDCDIYQVSIGANAGCQKLRQTQSPILGLAWFESTGLIALLEIGGALVVAGPMQGRVFGTSGPTHLKAPRSAVLTSDNKLLIADSSSDHAGTDWVMDFMNKGNSGRIIAIDINTEKAQVMASGLTHPSSLLLSKDEKTAYITEAWSAEVSSISLRSYSSEQRPKTILSNLPGFPWKCIRVGSDVFVSFLTMRTQLLEFILAENEFRKKMVATVPREFWVAPSITLRSHVYEPVQGGQLLQHGIAKPWAPPRSYGLVAKLTQSFDLKASYHSRYGGTVHGIMGLAASDGEIFCLSHAAKAIVKLDASQNMKSNSNYE